MRDTKSSFSFYKKNLIFHSMTGLKEKLIQKIMRSANEDLLEEIYKVLEEEGNEEVIQLSDNQLQSIQKAEKEYEKGDFFTQKEIDNKLDEWLGE